MFPNNDDRPAASAENQAGLAITLFCALKFLSPPIGISRGNHSVSRTTVPEATANFDRNSCLPKKNIDATAELGNRTTVESIAKTEL
jgi:hypothetical protein